MENGEWRRKEKGERTKDKGQKKKARPTEYLLTGADPTYIDIVVPRRKSVMHANAHYTLYIILYSLDIIHYTLPKAKPHYEL